MKDSCQICVFFFRTPDNQDQCRRNPPILLHSMLTPDKGAMWTCGWPGTGVDQWCGEFKRKTNIVGIVPRD